MSKDYRVKLASMTGLEKQIYDIVAQAPYSTDVTLSYLYERINQPFEDIEKAVHKLVVAQILATHRESGGLELWV